MKRACCAIVLSVLAAAAPGDVRFYFTSSADPAGLADTRFAFKNTDGNGTDGTGTEYVLNGNTPTVGTATINPIKGDFLYLWMAFEDEPDKRRIAGINLVVHDHPAFEKERGIYLGNDLNDGGEGQGSLLRWELNSQTSDPMTLVAIDAPGIVNKSSEDWLYYGRDRTALLGAIRFSSDPNDYRYGTVGIRIGLGYNGVKYRGAQSPKVKLGASDQEFDGGVQQNHETRYPDAFSAFLSVPEPGTVYVIVVLGLLVRRR